MSQRVLLLGANGQVGYELAARFAGPGLFAPSRAEADLSRPESLRAVVRAAQPQLILNAAAYTAVDRAESEPELADRVNHQAPAVLAQEAERCGAVLIHYSTDYVFDGSGIAPWVETDEPAPLSVYGTTKLAGERAIARACSRHIILRTSWVYAPRGHNFLLTMLRLGREREELRIVDDQHGAPTTAAALAETTRAIAGYIALGQGGAPGKWAGVYHATCEGQTTWADFARAIFAEAAGREPRAQPRIQGIPSAEYPTPAQRPRNSVLSNNKLWKQFSTRLPQWELALKTTFEHFG